MKVASQQKQKALSSRRLTLRAWVNPVIRLGMDGAFYIAVERGFNLGISNRRSSLYY